MSETRLPNESDETGLLSSPTLVIHKPSNGRKRSDPLLGAVVHLVQHPNVLLHCRKPAGALINLISVVDELSSNKGLDMLSTSDQTPLRPKQRRWNGVDDPISHCLAGNSLLLTGLPGTGKTHLARTIVARLREQGEAVRLVSKTHCSAQNLGLGEKIVKGEFKELFFLLFFLQQQHNKQKTKSRTTSKQNK